MKTKQAKRTGKDQKKQENQKISKEMLKLADSFFDDEEKKEREATEKKAKRKGIKETPFLRTFRNAKLSIPVRVNGKTQIVEKEIRVRYTTQSQINGRFKIDNFDGVGILCQPSNRDDNSSKEFTYFLNGKCLTAKTKNVNKNDLSCSNAIKELMRGQGLPCHLEVEKLEQKEGIVIETGIYEAV